MRRILCLLLVLLVVWTAGGPAFADEEISDERNDVILYGSAVRLPTGAVELTDLVNWSSGSLWYSHQISTKEGFEIQMEYYAGGGQADSYGGADGIVLSFGQRIGLGANGEYLGFVGQGAYGIELDSYFMNKDDPEGKHVAIIKDSVSNHLAYTFDMRVDDSQWHRLKIVYEPGEIYVYIGNTPVLYYKGIQLPEFVYLGVSASTGAGKNRHMIQNFAFEGVASKGESFEGDDRYEIDFQYASGENKDYSAVCRFRNSYFLQPSCGDMPRDGYNPSLATASLCLALSAFGSNARIKEDYSKEYQNLEDFLTKLDFENFAYNHWYTLKPQTDSIGVGMAHKLIRDLETGETTPLIAIGVRGGGYESEWSGNFTLGTSGQHKGFAAAKDQVLIFLKDYIAKNNISGDIKVWIAGFSRAGATSNLVAGALDDGYSLGNGVRIAREDLYAYCFEPPMGADKNSMGNPWKYYNIYNIVNHNDPVTKVAMSGLGFTRYGVDYMLPSPVTEGNDYAARRGQMERFYKLMKSYEVTGAYQVDDFTVKRIDLNYLDAGGSGLIVDDQGDKSTQGAVLDWAISTLTAEQIKNRENYVAKFQTGLRVLFNENKESLLPGAPATDAELESIVGSLVEDLEQSPEMTHCIQALWSGKNEASVSKAMEDFLQKLVVHFLNEAGISGYDPQTMTQFVKDIAGMAISFALSHINMVVTLASNLDTLGAAHYPELCLAWLMSQDSNYVTGVNPTTGNYCYRKIWINCPVDVEVFNTRGQRVGQIYWDSASNENNGGLLTVDSDEAKLLYLPANCGYTVYITAREDCTMHCSIQEFSASEGAVTKLVNYPGQNMVTDQTYQLEVPAYSEEELAMNAPVSQVQYVFGPRNGEAVQPQQTVTGDGIAQLQYTVNVSGNGESGSVIGGGSYYAGQFSQVEAVPKDGYTFAGWYDGDTKVSDEAIYRFCVEGDRTLSAKFEKEKSPVYTPTPTPPYQEPGGSLAGPIFLLIMVAAGVVGFLVLKKKLKK